MPARNLTSTGTQLPHEIQVDDRPTFTVPVARVERKIALEEHIESSDFPATGSHPFVREDYFSDVERRLQEYPNLTVVLGHLGEALPFTLPRLESRLRHQNPGSLGKCALRPTEYLRRNFFATTAGAFRTQALVNTISEVGSDRVMFSVDYPYESMQEAADWFDNCPISDNDLVKIGRTNAAHLFNIT